MKKEDNDSNIRMILQEGGLQKTSDQFSTHLNEIILDQSKRKRSHQLAVNLWLGRALAGIALAWLIIFFYYANPFSVKPAVSIAAMAFILGLWGLFAIVKKSIIARIDLI